ncbi:MAG TPA: TraX family protein, partial [Tissierellaceae bacterium]
MKENNFINNGLSSYKIKLIALFFMLLDHIYYYFSFTDLIPIGFKWVGRTVAVLFIYMTVEGYLYTRSLKKYLKRLYIGSVLMNVFNN